MSFAKPGSMPDVRNDERPSRTRRRGGRAPGKNECGWTSGTTELSTPRSCPRRGCDRCPRWLERAEVGGRGVADAVGVRGEERVDVVRRSHPGRRPSAERAGVATDFRRTVDPQAHELELRMVDDVAQRVRADVPGAPLDHAIGHWRVLSQVIPRRASTAPPPEGGCPAPPGPEPRLVGESGRAGGVGRREAAAAHQLVDRATGEPARHRVGILPAVHGRRGDGDRVREPPASCEAAGESSGCRWAVRWSCVSFSFSHRSADPSSIRRAGPQGCVTSADTSVRMGPSVHARQATYDLLSDPPVRSEVLFEIAAHRILTTWLDTREVVATDDDVRLAGQFLRRAGLSLEPVSSSEVRLVSQRGESTVLSREAAVLTAVRSLAALEAQRIARSIARAA